MNAKQYIAYKMLNAKDVQTVAKRLAKDEPAWYVSTLKTLDSAQREVRTAVSDFIRPSK